MQTNAVGIDVSKGKSTIAVMRPFGDIIRKPFRVSHSSSELKELADSLGSLEGETRIIMEYTGKYYQPIARYLVDSGFYVSVVLFSQAHTKPKAEIFQNAVPVTYAKPCFRSWVVCFRTVW